MIKQDERRFFLKHIAALSAFIAGSILSFKNRSSKVGKIGQTEAYGMSSSGNAAYDALEARVTALEDREKIKELMHTYKNSFFDAEWDVITSLFADDSTGFIPTIDIKPDGTNVGRGITEVKRQFGNMALAHIKGAETGHIYHYHIDVNWDRAKATWLVTDNMHRLTDDGQTRVGNIYGKYTIECVKINGEWKFTFFQHRHRQIQAVEATPPPPD